MEEFDPTRDDPRTKVVLLETNKIFLKRTDPYGLIELSLERGSLPDWLKTSKYTTWEAANEAVKAYLRERDTVAFEVQPPKPTPPERKKVS